MIGTQTITGSSADREDLKIAVFGVFGAGNLGNDSTLYAMIYNLRKHLPGSLFSCICSGPEETASRFSVSALPIRKGQCPQLGNRILRKLAKFMLLVPMEFYRWFHVIKTARKHDLLIMTGTGMLSDLGITPFGLHYDILRWSIAARLSGCRLLFVSMGVGPIRSWLSRFFVKTALGAAHYRSYRDEFSKEYLAGIGFRKSEDMVCPDLAFSLPVPPRNRYSNAITGTTVGFGLITHNRRRATGKGDAALYEEYISKAASFVSWLLEQNYNVQLLIGDAIYDERARQDLMSILDKQSGLKKETLTSVPPARSFEELLPQLANLDLVVASRFHNVLLSLMSKKPVVAISFHEKVDALMRAFGLEAFTQDIEQIDLERLKAQFLALETESNQLSIQIGQKVDAYRSALEKQYQVIARMVELPQLVAK